MPQLTLSVPGISCGHCVAAITTELEALAGVVAVEVSLDARTVSVDGDVERDAVVAAIGNAGYDVS